MRDFQTSTEGEFGRALTLEGLVRSGGIFDLGFEYQYFRADGTTLCGGGPTGPVVAVTGSLAVAAGSGAPFDRHRKLLITGTGTVAATVTPVSTGTESWSYDGDGSFAAPAALRTEFIAGTAFTPAPRDSRFIRFRLDEDGQVIEAFHPVNLTAPRQVRTNVAGFDSTSGWNDAVPSDRFPADSRLGLDPAIGPAEVKQRENLVALRHLQVVPHEHPSRWIPGRMPDGSLPEVAAFQVFRGGRIWVFGDEQVRAELGSSKGLDHLLGAVTGAAGYARRTLRSESTFT